LRDGVGETCAIAPIKDSGGLEKKGVRFRAARRGFYKTRLLFAVQDDLELLRDGARNSLLQTEDIAQVAIVGFRPEVKAVGDLNQLHRDADLVTLRAHRALQDVGDAKSRADAAQLLIFAAERKR
jgi:hypothetical protein